MDVIPAPKFQRGNKFNRKRRRDNSQGDTSDMETDSMFGVYYFYWQIKFIIYTLWFPYQKCCFESYLNEEGKKKNCPLFYA